MTKKKRRFSSPVILDESTKFLGATAGEWDRALTGNFAETLIVVKKLAVDAGLAVPLDERNNSLPDE